jgi:long-chain acyl-CoA synthetase
MKGYWNNEDETKNVITPDGWFKTGDVGYMREDGYFKIVDRIKDVIIISGFNIYPSEIEEVVLKHENIFEAACVGIQNKDGSESIKLFVSLKPGEVMTNDEIIEYCRSQLTAYKVPKIIEFIEEIPKSNVGKVLRRELRERVSDA